MRTQEEIVERIRTVEPIDAFGAQRSDLIQALEYEHAEPFLPAGVTEELWNPAATEEEIREEARDYLAFAVDKAENHRGLSAARAIDHYSAWVWLLAPERFDEFMNAPYVNYGTPKLKKAAEILGFPERWEELVGPDSQVDRMANGVECSVEGCYGGCA